MKRYFSRLKLTGEQLQQLADEQPAGTSGLPIVFGQIVRERAGEWRDGTLIVAWRSPADTTAGLEAAGVLGVAELERRARKRARAKQARADERAKMKALDEVAESAVC